MVIGSICFATFGLLLRTRPTKNHFQPILLCPVCHAEMNAILNKNTADTKGCSLYVALFPCNECTKLVIQSGIKEVVYYSDKYHDLPSMKASRKLLQMAGVTYR